MEDCPKGIEVETETPNVLFGALAGDFVGSVYEHHNIKFKNFPLISRKCRLTDDSIMTLATAEAILSGSTDYASFYHKRKCHGNSPTPYLSVWTKS